MPHNNFSDIDFTASLIALLTGIWGALLNFLKRDKSSHSMLSKVWLFFADMTVNIGLTMLIYIGCIGYGLNDLVSVAFAGFLGHQGTRSMYLVNLIIAEKVGAKETFKTIKDENGSSNGKF